jgi:hypothetical protein
MTSKMYRIYLHSSVRVLGCVFNYVRGKYYFKEATKCPEEGGGVALLILDLGARRMWVVSTTPRQLYPRDRPVPIVEEAGWAPGPFWTCAENLAPRGIYFFQSPGRPARCQSLYRLSYRTHKSYAEK